MAEPRGAAVHDVREGVEEIKRDAVGIKAVLERMEKDRGNRNSNSIRVEGMGSFWNGVCLGGVFGISIVVALWVGGSLAGINASINAERQSRQQMENWMVQEVTSVRSYITNGRLVPMKPRPTDQPQQEK